MCEWGDKVEMEVTVPAYLSNTGEAKKKRTGIDACIAPIVKALNDAGILTAASCCGHGSGTGSIVLHDGLELQVVTHQKEWRMGWSNCGTDSRGRPIGYGHAATCDHPGCEAQIDRGLAYACGSEHGASGWYCDRYYCEKHLYFPAIEDDAWEFLKTQPENVHLVFCRECCDVVEKWAESDVGKQQVATHTHDSW